MQFMTSQADPDLLDLPWPTPLEEWDSSYLAALPRGISRHIVRFVKVGSRIIAAKEIKEEIAFREYDMLRSLNKMELPSVTPYGIVSGRVSESGEPLDAILLTDHLQFSLPYRALFSQRLQPETVLRLLDALAVLLARLHLAGFWWGDVSLSNTLFRRDAGSFAAYLVDAETGQLFPSLTRGQREHDLDIARVNIAGELMDLAAGGVIPDDADPIEISDRILSRYAQLWDELTGLERFERGDRWRLEERVRRLNKLGFDVDEFEMSTDSGGAMVQIQPKVVDAGHHRRRLMRLTGLDVQENQARRLLNDLDAYRASFAHGESEELAAHQWMLSQYEPVVHNIPAELSAKLEAAQVFHEVLEHRWYLSERTGHDITTQWAFADYLTHVLPRKPDERAVVGVDTVEMPVIAMFDD